MASSTPSKPAAEADSELFYQSLNPTGSETILMIHGAFDSSKQWDDVTPLLIENGYHVLLPDLPAHGRSVSIQPFTVDSAAHLILDLVTKYAQNDSAHIVGLSLGAHVAACIAERAKLDQILSVLASGFNEFRPPSLVAPLFAPLIFCLHHLTMVTTEFQAEMAALRNGQASYALIAEVTRTLVMPREIGDIHERVLVVASASPDTWVGRDRCGSSKRLLEAIVDRHENGSRAVMHRGIRHEWHMHEPTLFGKTVIAWARREQLDGAFEDIE